MGFEVQPQQFVGYTLPILQLWMGVNNTAPYRQWHLRQPPAHVLPGNGNPDNWLSQCERLPSMTLCRASRLRVLSSALRQTSTVLLQKFHKQKFRLFPFE